MKQNRRHFLRKVSATTAAASMTPWVMGCENPATQQETADTADSTATDSTQADTAAAPPYQAPDQSAASPNASQKAWMELGFGLFIHFGINTYYDKEWSDGSLDPVKFNPTQLDTDQWCRAAKAAGMKYIVLITKHHDGFCLWPTKHTDYSVKSSPFKGDVVAEVFNSAEKYGLKVGLYYSLWDRHEKSHDENEAQYVDFMKAQLEELLTGYGEVVELWFDGMWKKQNHGWKKNGQMVSGPEFVEAWRYEGAYRWQMDHLYQYIKGMQKNCLVMNNATTEFPGVPLHPVDIRSGEKATEGEREDQKVWNWLGKPYYMPLQIETTLSQKGFDDKFESGSWFWHERDDSVASKEQVLTWLETAKKLEANLLLNAGPNPEGKLRPLDYERLMGLRE